MGTHPEHPWAQGSEVDERWVPEWVEYGLAQIVQYLSRYAAFEDYCDRHPRPEENHGDQAGHEDD